MRAGSSPAGATNLMPVLVRCLDDSGSLPNPVGRGVQFSILAANITVASEQAAEWYVPLAKGFAREHGWGLQLSGGCSPRLLSTQPGGARLKSPDLMPIADRIRSSSSVDPATGCWVWNKYKNKEGYGQIGFRSGGKNQVHPAHRISYTYLVGPIPPGLQIDHLCRNKSCVNPEHLEPVTQQENIRRRPLSGPQGRTDCPYGHANQVFDKRGLRRCKTCAVIANRKWKAKRKLNQQQETL